MIGVTVRAAGPSSGGERARPALGRVPRLELMTALMLVAVLAQAAPAAASERMSYRENLRITLLAGIGVGDLVRGHPRDASDRFASMGGSVLALGVRKNFTPWFGGQTQVRAWLGSISAGGQDYDPTAPDAATFVRETNDQTEGYELALESSLHLNFWRFYLGPVASIGRRRFDKPRLVTDRHEYDLHRRTINGSLGGQIGLLASAREVVDFNLRISSGVPVALRQIFFTVGFHILP